MGANSFKALSISRETVRQIALTVDRYQVMRARHGTLVANAKRKPRADRESLSQGTRSGVHARDERRGVAFQLAIQLAQSHQP